jgi:hypothetical protein
MVSQVILRDTGRTVLLVQRVYPVIYDIWTFILLSCGGQKSLPLLPYASHIAVHFVMHRVSCS